MTSDLVPTTQQQLLPATRQQGRALALFEPAPARFRPDVEVPRAQTRRLVISGCCLAIGLLASFGVWAVTVPLASAVIAPGVVKVLSQRRAVQHLEGGIVNKLLVREGNVVERGQLLAVLDTTQIEATLGTLESRLFSDLALEARLEAEQSRLSAVVFPDELQKAQNRSEARLAMATQRSEFGARASSLVGQRTLIDQQLQQQSEAIRGLQSSSEGITRQLQFIREEIKDSDYLLSKGLARKPKVLALKRAEVEAETQIASNASAVAQAKAKTAELNDRRRQIDYDWQQDIAQQRRGARDRIADARHRIAAARDMLTRAEVRSPEAGTVVGLNTRQADAVLSPRETLLEIVPMQDRLVVEGELRPVDRNEVRIGQQARVRVLSFNSRRSPDLSGVVTMITADTLTDRSSGRSFYKSEIDLTVPPGFTDMAGTLQAGMPVEIHIETGHRTFAEYVTEPLLLRANRALREK